MGPDLERLRAAALRVKTAEQTWKDALEARDALLIEAMDSGRPVHEVAAAALLGKPRVLQILARDG